MKMTNSVVEEEDKFYESLDRILSSSCSSTSASDDESDIRNRHRFPPPAAAAAASAYEVWITEPGPVQDRRKRLLQMMGLAGDPAKSPISVVNSGELAGSGGGVAIDSSADGCDEPRYTIRNLDTGREFVVKEFREDGMWKKLREIGTDQQLTMEEFEICVGKSPIVHELMRRQNVDSGDSNVVGQISVDEMQMRLKKRGGWLKSIFYYKQNESHHIFNGVERVRVRQCGKSFKEFSGLYLTQEIKAHSGSIWSVRFSLDGRYLATAGEDCVIHVWQAAVENGISEVGKHWEKKMRSRMYGGRKSLSLENAVVVPEHFFMLEEKPFCSFKGHLDDVLDLSWSKSQYLLSSSMDKTVRLWHISSSVCLKIFSHSDYVTCIQFNPVDDRYFISGSLDKKIRIWSIPDCRVVDWNDLHEMVTAACYMPDGKGALVGSHKGSCHMYDTTDNKLHKKIEIDLKNKKKKSNHKKITGFQFAPGKNSELLITSADSRIRVVDGVQLVHKLKGFRNTSSQISASLTSNGNYAICASEDSHVYIWRYSSPSQPRRKCTGGTNTTQSYEHFHCSDVTAAIPWPNSYNSTTTGSIPAVESPNNNLFGDKASVTWPEEKLMVSSTPGNRRRSTEIKNGGILLQSNSAWGMVIVTAGRGGQIRTFQNFGFPVKS